MFLSSWRCQINWHILVGFKTIILYFAHPIYDSWNVFSPKIWLVKTSTRIMIYKSWVFKSNPVLLSMLMILLSILCVIRHLICGRNLNWLLNLYLIYETLWTGVGSGLLSFAIDMKMDGSVFEEESSFNMLWVTFSSKLDWGTYIISMAKTASKKIGALIIIRSFFLLRLLCIFLF